MIDVALDARLTDQMSVGMRTYAVELRTRLPRVAPDLRFRAFDEGPNFGWAEQVALPRALRRARPRLVHYLSLYAPVAGPRPYVVTIHDLIHLRFPQYFKRRVAPYYRIVVRRLCRRAAGVITDDERTIGDLERFLGVDPARVRVIPLGVGEQYLHNLAPQPPPRPYFLYAGNHRPHKDLATLAAAWAALPPELAADLVVTGDDDLADLRRRFGRPAGELRALGGLTDSALAHAYRNARALVHPALTEGFGLPMLEAMAVGTPVIACDAAVPGVLRPWTATFAPRDVAALRAAMIAALGESAVLRERAAEGRTFARTLTWDRCAAATAAVYREHMH